MSHILRISEATSLALHSMAFLASKGEGELVSTRDIAKRLKASEAHLSKVLQRLSRVGLVKAFRGPKGGFALGKAPDQISLLEIYEAVEGQMVTGGCLFDKPICDGVKCIWSDLLARIGKEVKSYLESKRLSEFKDVFVKDEEAHSLSNS